MEFLNERAKYWNEHEPVNPPPPPSELALRLSRMRTFHTMADSGMDSMMSSARPHSADDAQESSRTGREMSRSVPPLDTNRSIKTLEPKEEEVSERKPPTGRSAFAPSPSKHESFKKEKTVTIDDSPHENVKNNPKSGKLPKSTSSQKIDSSIKGQNVSDECLLPGNVLSISDT